MSDAQTTSKGRFWIGFVVVLLGLNVGVCALTVYAALSTRGASIEKDYYQKALHWDTTKQQRELNAALGWSLAVRLEQTETAGTMTVLVTLKDGANAGIRNAKLKAEAFHTGHRERAVTLKFESLGEGEYRATLPVEFAGTWRFSFIADAVGMTFTSEQDVLLLEESAGA